MNGNFKKTMLVFFFTINNIAAHQPRIVTGDTIKVFEPEISKAYYAQLTGKSHQYTINSRKPFDLYVNILVPNISGQKTDLLVKIMKDGKNIRELDGKSFEWKKFWEPYGYSAYLKGPEYKKHVEAGSYEINISSLENNRKYSLAIGELESFGPKEIINALDLVPKIKRHFFEESPANFIFSPFGIGYIGIIFLIAFLGGSIVCRINKKFFNKAKDRHKRPKIAYRLFFAVLSIGLVTFALITSWNPLILFLAGYALFKAVFSCP